MTLFCRCHCRSCGAHFTSLEAFDGHRSDGECTFPDDAGLVESSGVCKIDDPTQPQVGVVVYSHERAERARQAFGGRDARQTARAERKSGVPAA